MNQNAVYWDTGVADVPRVTGTNPSLMDCHEIRGICQTMGIALPFPSVLDVGCGTGRVSQLADSYVGADISPSAITYCRDRHIEAYLIEGPDDLATWPSDSFSWVLGWSVFTHIGREEQRAYLAQFVRLAPHLLIDILPGDTGHTAARWGSDEAAFRQDLIDAGYTIGPVTPDLVDPHGVARHRYYLGDRQIAADGHAD